MDTQGPVMVLFMGGTEDHAETSFQKYLPESVHIITSDKYAEKYEELLDKWSSGYGFRRGVVNFVDDLFEPSGVNSLVGAFYGALFDERENGPEQPILPNWPSASREDDAHGGHWHIPSSVDRGSCSTFRQEGRL